MVTTVVIFVASVVLGECRDLSSPTTHNATVRLCPVSVHAVHSRRKHVRPEDESDHLAHLAAPQLKSIASVTGALVHMSWVSVREQLMLNHMYAMLDTRRLKRQHGSVVEESGC